MVYGTHHVTCMSCKQYFVCGDAISLLCPDCERKMREKKQKEEEKKQKEEDKNLREIELEEDE